MTETTETSQPMPADQSKIRSALLRYRVLAWITGVWLLLLIGNMIVHYGFGKAGFSWIGIAHGWIYFIYLIFAVDLSIKVRWPLKKVVLTALAGTIPFLSFYVEHIRTRDVKTEFNL